MLLEYRNEQYFHIRYVVIHTLLVSGTVRTCKRHTSGLKLYTTQADSLGGMKRQRNYSYNQPMPEPTIGHRDRASSTVQKTSAAWQCANGGSGRQIAQAPRTASGDIPSPQLS